MRSRSLPGTVPRCRSEMTALRTARSCQPVSLGLPRERPLLPPQPLHRRLPDLLEGHAARVERTVPKPRAREIRRSRRRQQARSGAQFRGPYATAGPYDRDGERVEVRLEKVPGGIRLAEWANGALRRAAPVLPAADLGGAADAGARAADPPRARAREARDGGGRGGRRATGRVGIERGPHGRPSRGAARRGRDDGAVRIARWIFRPGAGLGAAGGAADAARRALRRGAGRRPPRGRSVVA